MVFNIPGNNIDVFPFLRFFGALPGSLESNNFILYLYVISLHFYLAYAKKVSMVSLDLSSLIPRHDLYSGGLVLITIIIQNTEGLLINLYTTKKKKKVEFYTN